ncbi:MAG TPA: amidohydrolase family protein [Chloroflexota bacterium]|nr:amidohydrolase family protein [Chloroflexota bacterium]
MLQDIYIYDADAHVMMSPAHWQDLPEHLRDRRPRPIRIEDDEGLGGWNNAWLLEDQVGPRHWGPGSQPVNSPASTDSAFPGGDLLAMPLELGSRDLSWPELRLKDLDGSCIDASVVYPSTFYARMTSDPELAAALYRSYNRYVGKACHMEPRRLKWAGLVPLCHPYEACQAVNEMKELGASAGVCFGTSGNQLLSDPVFSPIFDELAGAGLPLSIHFGMSYPPYLELSRTTFSGQFVGMTLPLFLAVYAAIGGGLMDRYPSLKVAFLEFSSEWLLFAIPRLEIFRKQALRRGTPLPTDLPQSAVADYFRSGRIFVTCEEDDSVLRQELELVGEDVLMYASDIPHAEMRENAAVEIFGRKDLTDSQKRKILGENAVRYYGQP